MNQRGQALVEYLIASAALAVALFSPWLGGLSPATLLLAVLLRAYRNYAFLLAIS